MPYERTTLDCPCGERLVGDDEEQLVAVVREHLAAVHPDLDYSREQILFLAF